MLPFRYLHLKDGLKNKTKNKVDCLTVNVSVVKLDINTTKKHCLQAIIARNDFSQSVEVLNFIFIIQCPVRRFIH